MKRTDKMATLGVLARKMGLVKRTLQNAAQMGYLQTTTVETPVGAVRMTTEQAVREWLAGPNARPRKKARKS